MFLEQFAQLADGPRQKVSPQVEPGQRSLGELEPLGLTALQLRVEATQLLGYHLVVRRQLERTLEVPDRCLEVPLLLGNLAHAYPGKQMLRVGAEHAFEHVGGMLVLTSLEHCLAHQPIGLEALWILVEDVPAMRDSFLVALLLDGTFDLLAILGQGNLVHGSTSHRMIRCRGAIAVL